MSALARQRLLWSGLALASLSVLVLSRWLTPSPSGVGTHVELGLPPCGFLLWSGLPCPACGLTTAFALLARGELALSLQANPLGLPLFLTAAALPWVSLSALRRDESLAVVIDRFAADRVALLLVVGMLLSWAARLASLL